MEMAEKWMKNWLNGFYIVGLALLMIMVGWGGHWPERFRLVWMVSIILPIHACEEWQIPGGFHYQYNLTMGSQYPDRYPMSRLTDMLTIVIAEVLYLCCLFFYQQTWIVMGLCGFALLEFGAHTYFGIAMYRRFKSAGKRTIYNPGMASAYLGWGVLAGLMIANIATTTGTTGKDWLFAALMLVFMGIVEVYLPERIFKDKNTKYGYASPRYFTKFIQKSSK